MNLAERTSTFHCGGIGNVTIFGLTQDRKLRKQQPKPEMGEHCAELTRKRRNRFRADTEADHLGPSGYESGGRA